MLILVEKIYWGESSYIVPLFSQFINSDFVKLLNYLKTCQMVTTMQVT